MAKKNKRSSNEQVDTEDKNVKNETQQQQQQQLQSVLGPITQDGERPQKKFYRQRAHCNPLAHNDTFEYPVIPCDMDWSIDHYPIMTTIMNQQQHTLQLQPTVLDIGCGFGGLTIALASILPNEYVLGMEIRAKVTEYVRLRIVNARTEYKKNHQNTIITTTSNEVREEKTEQHDKNESTTMLASTESPVTNTPMVYPNSKIEHQRTNHNYQNCSVLRTNSMKFLPNYFHPHSISKLLICFPDPHFKRKNFPRRIITVRLLSVYAYVLKMKNNNGGGGGATEDEGSSGKLYCITDVKELHEWHINALTEHPLFHCTYLSSDDEVYNQSIRTPELDEINNAINKEDLALIDAMKNETEEGKKVTRNNGNKYYAIYECYEKSDYVVDATNFFAH